MLLELGNYGLSCIWYNVNPLLVVGIRMYHFQEHASGKEIASHLGNLLKDAEFTERQISFCMNVKESILIPSEFFSHSYIYPMLDLGYGKDDGSARSDTVHISQHDGDQVCYNSYRINRDIAEILSHVRMSPEILHSTSLQIKCDAERTFVRAIVYHHIIKLLLFKEGKVQLVQQFPYKTPADAAYLLLNACHQHAMLPGEVEVVISGIIDKDSNLYREISKYFLQLNLDQVNEAVQLDDELKDVSAHYFSHLTHLIACV